MKDWKIGIIISGSASRGSYQCGCIQAIHEFFDREQIKIITGSSVGAINAYALASNKVSMLKSWWENCDYPNLLSIVYNVRINKIVDQMIDSLVDETDNLDIPLYVTTSCVKKLTLYYWLMHNDYKDWWKGRLRQGMSFPILVPSGKFKKDTHRDGGIFDNVPIWPIVHMEEKLDFLLILQTDPKFIVPSIALEHSNVVYDMTVNAKSIKNDRFIFKKNQLTSNLNDGYDYCLNTLHAIFDEAESIEDLRKNAHKLYNIELETRRKIVSADTWVTKLNNLFWNIIAK